MFCVKSGEITITARLIKWVDTTVRHRDGLLLMTNVMSSSMYKWNERGSSILGSVMNYVLAEAARLSWTLRVVWRPWIRTVTSIRWTHRVSGNGKITQRMIPVMSSNMHNCVKQQHARDEPQWIAAQRPLSSHTVPGIFWVVSPWCGGHRSSALGSATTYVPAEGASDREIVFVGLYKSRGDHI